MKNINFVFYGVLLFILMIGSSIFYFFGSKFLEKENDLVGSWKVKKMSFVPIQCKKYHSKEQKQLLLQLDSILHSKKDTLFLEFETTRFIFQNTNNGKLKTNFFETNTPIAWHYLKEKNQIALYRKKELDIFWEIKALSNSTLSIKTIYGNSEWIMEFSKKE